ncbi:MarR family winged helix-turn-helix transcriptional regulator [Telluribacter humicola]|uniref:MarR family winged helix-turn-helix transcriptional regulator n=1 Tax=Telluribacter humicola TaxID=1720261 RepID=UPI001A9574E2|nr:MarR family transcriptional regulator [Telluribacter humicola]
MAIYEYDKSYGRTLGIAYTQVYRRLAKYLKERDIPVTPDQFRVLTHLWQNDSCSQQHLAEGTNRDRANVTRIIDILEREGIVERQPHESDRRAFRIVLTEKGKAIEAEAAECGRQAIQDSLEGVTPEELEVCMRVLRKTIQNLT